jgi:hypothetical protein
MLRDCATRKTRSLLDESVARQVRSQLCDLEQLLGLPIEDVVCAGIAIAPRVHEQVPVVRAARDDRVDRIGKRGVELRGERTPLGSNQWTRS